ncbi:MAG: type II CAAX prenyl endopeptidase Rce1 family protein [Promethearchaeota archaeon]
MIKVRKYIILSILLIILTLPIFFGVYLEYFTIREINWFVILIFLIGISILLILGKIIEIYGYNDKIVEAIRKQDVINAFINRNDRIIIWLFFPIIIIIEELVFRYYNIGVLIHILEMESAVAIFISSLVFSSYHIHIWFRYKNLKILLINLGYSFLIGLYNGYIFLQLGIIPCILIHYSIVLFLYYNIYRRYFKKKRIKNI